MSATEHWLGQDGVAWNILLVGHLEQTPATNVLRERLAAVFTAQHWPAPSTDAVREGSEAELLAAYAVTNVSDPVSVGRTPHGVVLRGHHAYLDGLGLLAVLRELALPDLASSARGVAGRGRRSTLGSLAARLTEVAVRPPAPVPGSPGVAGTDVLVSRELAGTVRTGALVHAGAVALDRRHVAVAVGVSTTGGADLKVGEHSGFLRFTDVDRMDRDDVDSALATAPLQLGGTARTSGSRRLGGAIRWASTRFASRLGSTLLVSHLGRASAEGLTGAAFLPFSGSGSGVSLGGVTVDDRTTLTLRARGSRHCESDLEQLLDRVVTSL